jgi:MFS family permease
MNLSIKDLLVLLHPIIGIVVLFPLLGLVVDRALLVRRRRQDSQQGHQSKIPPSIGVEHVKLGRYLAIVVVGLALLGMCRPIFSYLYTENIWNKNPLQVIQVILLYVTTIGSFICLDRSKQIYWRSIFAVLTSLGLIILGSQKGIFPRNDEWFVSHFYYGLSASILTICAMAMLSEIYRDRTNRWRNAHIILNCLALLFFIGQGATGTRDLLEISLGWQETYLSKCDYLRQICPGGN